MINEILSHKDLSSIPTYLSLRIKKDVPGRLINTIREDWVAIGDHKSSDCLYQKFLDIGAEFFIYCDENNVQDIYWEETQSAKPKRVNLYEWLLENHGKEKMRDFARIAREVFDRDFVKTFDEFIESYGIMDLANTMTRIFQRWYTHIYTESKSKLEGDFYYLADISQEFYKFCKEEKIEEVYWEVTIHADQYKQQQSKSLKETKMKKTKRDIMSASDRKKMHSIAKRYFAGGRKTPVDREVLVELLGEVVSDYLYKHKGERFTTTYNIRVTHYLQKMKFGDDSRMEIYKDLEIEEIFDFLAILKHDTDKHTWIIDEARKAFDQYLKTGSKKDRKTTLFESSSLKISFNAEKMRLTLTKYDRRHPLRQPKKYKAKLNVNELVYEMV
jgi:hypothetical protein